MNTSPQFRDEQTEKALKRFGIKGIQTPKKMLYVSPLITTVLSFILVGGIVIGSLIAHDSTIAQRINITNLYEQGQ